MRFPGVAAVAVETSRSDHAPTALAGGRGGQGELRRPDHRGRAAGRYSVDVLLQVYAKCVKGQEELANRRDRRGSRRLIGACGGGALGPRSSRVIPRTAAEGCFGGVWPPMPRKEHDGPWTVVVLVRDRTVGWWRVLGSNQRRLSRRFYRETTRRSPIGWLTCPDAALTGRETSVCSAYVPCWAERRGG